MRHYVRPLFAVLTISLVLMQFDNRAQARAPHEVVSQFTQDYKLAFQTGNPFLLAHYDPAFRVFGRLVESHRFDHNATSRVELRNIDLVDLPDEPDTLKLTFEKIQEDLQKSGMFTRGIARIEMTLHMREDGMQVLSHQVLPPEGAPANYSPEDPRSWGKEHSTVETYLFKALESLRDGEMETAHNEVGGAILQVETVMLPDFLMGQNYFVGMCYYVKGMIEFKNGYFEKAEDALSTALSVHKDFPLALNLLARIEFSEADYEQALQFWKHSVSTDPRQWAVAALMETLDEAVDSKSKRRRNLLLDLIDLTPSQAIQVLAPDVRKRPRDTFVAGLLARAYIQSRDPEKALEVLESTRRIGRDEDTTYLAARVQLLLKDSDAALELFEKVWDLQPDYKDTLVFLVELYAAAGRYEDALVRLKTAPQKTERSGVRDAILGHYYMKEGRFLDSVEYISRATLVTLPTRIRVQVARLQKQMDSHRR